MIPDVDLMELLEYQHGADREKKLSTSLKPMRSLEYQRTADDISGFGDLDRRYRRFGPILCRDFLFKQEDPAYRWDFLVTPREIERHTSK